MKQPADKLWSELTSEQVRYFFERLKSRVDAVGTRAQSALSEFAKFLFAANSGSAAGIFLLLKPNPTKGFLLAFFLFCAGAFFVGIAHLLTKKWYEDLTDAGSEDMNAWGRDEITIRALDERHKSRLRSSKRYYAICGYYASFALLIGGAVLSAITMWKIAKG